MKLSLEQTQAIQHTKGPALILAVPGAGKTTVLIHRTQNLISKHRVDPSKILSITFSRASANDMKNRFNRSFPNQSGSRVNFSTIHGFCYALIREHSYNSGLKYKLIEDGKHDNNKYNILKQIYFSLNKDYITEDKLDNLLNAIGYIKNMMLPLDEFLENNKVDIAHFKDIFNQYESYKRNNNLLDFDDMLTLSLEILKNNRYLLEKYRSKFDFIQVDEGQDTSKVQLEIIKLLAYPKNNLFIVADDDQSIYGFRGAYPEGLLNFKKIYKDGKIFFMEKNYRSSQNIVSTINKFIQSNTKRYKKKVYTDNPFLEPINIIKLRSVEDQYKYLLEEFKDKDLSNSCILYRNNISSIGVIEFLETNKIPFYTRDKKLKFFNHWVINDVLSLMALAQDPSRMDLYDKLYYKIKGYISKKQINYAKKLNSNASVFQRILQFPGLNNYYKTTLRELDLDFKKLSKLKPKDAISFIEDNLEYDLYLKENSIKFGYTYDNLNTILFYLKMIAEKCKTLDQLLGRLKHIQSLCASSKDNKGVLTLSSIHSAKGLEFDRVYIIDLIDGDFPNSSSIEAFNKYDMQLLEEERRLFYVGMSRAKVHLSLITSNEINGRRVDASRFLMELETTCK